MCYASSNDLILKVYEQCSRKLAVCADSQQHFDHKTYVIVNHICLKRYIQYAINENKFIQFSGTETLIIKHKL